MKKSLRHAAILDLLQRSKIRTQEDLLNQLKEHGFKTTQATVSRDIRDLKIVKISDGEGGYKYSAALSLGDSEFASKLKTIFMEAVHRVDNACNLVVLKTYAGMGNAAGAAVDAMQLEGVVGTLAGDDNVLIIGRNQDSALEICRQLSQLLK